MKERPHKYEVELSEEQRFLLQQLLAGGKSPARQQAHTRILLKIGRNAPGPRWTDEQVAEALEMSRYTVIRMRERFVNHGLDDALNSHPHTQTRARAPLWRAGGASDCPFVQSLPARPGTLDAATACQSPGGAGLCRADQP